MAKEDKDRVETSILPLKYVDLVEDIFHAVLAIALFAIGVGAFFFSIKRLLDTAPFFPNGMIQGVNDTLERGKSDTAFDRAIYEMGLNALIVVALVFAIFMSKSAHRKAK